MKSELPLPEELDFQYLLQLLPPLEGEADFAYLPELFSIIGIDNMVTLCKYLGGETIKVPTLVQLTRDIEALQYFYDIYIKKCKVVQDVPEHLLGMVRIIKSKYDTLN